MFDLGLFIDVFVVVLNLSIYVSPKSFTAFRFQTFGNGVNFCLMFPDDSVVFLNS